MHIRRLLFSLVSLLLFAACSSKASTVELPELPTSLPADFSDFYYQFHTDSTYQMNHVQWPLRGVPDEQLEPGQQFAFQPADWSIQQLIDAKSTGYVSAFTAVGDDLVVEKIINKKDKAGLERRFLRRTDGEWELIYYQGVRPLE